MLIVGLLLIGFVIIAPNGIVGLWQNYVYHRKQMRSATPKEAAKAPAGGAQAGAR
jgi:hypothetical protein